jgi:hypothetical protein
LFVPGDLTLLLLEPEEEVARELRRLLVLDEGRRSAVEGRRSAVEGRRSATTEEGRRSPVLGRLLLLLLLSTLTVKTGDIGDGGDAAAIGEVGPVVIDAVGVGGAGKGGKYNSCFCCAAAAVAFASVELVGRAASGASALTSSTCLGWFLLEELLCSSAKQVESKCNSQSSQNHVAFDTPPQRSQGGKERTKVTGCTERLERRAWKPPLIPLPCCGDNNV